MLRCVLRCPRRQANWKLDPPLRKACKASVRDLCADQDRKNQETGLVYKCLISKYEDIDAACQKVGPRAYLCATFRRATGVVQHFAAGLVRFGASGRRTLSMPW